MIRCRYDVAQVQCFLVGDRVWDLEEVDVGEGRADVLGLAAVEAAGEVRVAEEAGEGLAVELFLQGGGVGAVAHAG